MDFGSGQDGSATLDVVDPMLVVARGEHEGSLHGQRLVMAGSIPRHSSDELS
ncbi:MAG: hypothetical protein JRG92_07455 [Deltaproteobacteria bacterium]|nr:hypothetical protein [Deltaproteobacteria bacterium]